MVEKGFRSSSFKLHCGADSERHSAFHLKPNSILLCLKTRNQHIKSQIPQTQTCEHSPPCCGGLAHVFKAWVKADGSHLIRIQRNLLPVGKKKKISTASPTNVKPGKIIPLGSFVRCFVTVLPTDPAMLGENTCFLFSALTRQRKNPQIDNSGNG